MSKHLNLIVEFVKCFREYIKEGRQPEHVHKILVEYSKSFPEELSSFASADVKSHIQHKFLSTPLELSSFLMPLLSEDMKIIPDGTALVPYRNQATQKWGFKDKLTGHVLIPAQFVDIESENEWVDGNIRVKKDYNYYELGRNQQLRCIGKNLVKIEGLGYIHTFFIKEYYDTNWKVQINKKEIAYIYGHLMKRGRFGWLTVCTSDKDTRPISDVSNCEIVKYLKKYSPRAILSTLFASFIYVFIIQ